MQTADIFVAAMALDATERRRLAYELLESLEGAPDEDAERLWNEELARRRQKVERGEAVFHPMEELQRRVTKALGGG